MAGFTEWSQVRHLVRQGAIDEDLIPPASLFRTQEQMIREPEASIQQKAFDAGFFLRVVAAHLDHHDTERRKVGILQLGAFYIEREKVCAVVGCGPHELVERLAWDEPHTLAPSPKRNRSRCSGVMSCRLPLAHVGPFALIGNVPVDRSHTAA